MGIKDDAGKLLVYFYQRYTANDENIDSKKVIDETKWESGRINRGIMYLKDLNAIKIQLYLGNTDGVYNFEIMGLTPLGVQTIEDKTEFKRSFGFEVGIPGVFKLNWGATEK